eukprot:1149062-Pelagomonas_calceolata.AAC.3
MESTARASQKDSSRQQAQWHTGEQQTTRIAKKQLQTASSVAQDSRRHQMMASHAPQDCGRQQLSGTRQQQASDDGITRITRQRQTASSVAQDSSRKKQLSIKAPPALPHK